MQFKIFAVLASLAAAAIAAPSELKRDDAADAAAANATLTTFFTTETFTATRVLQSMMTVSPWMTMITSQTVWSVAHSVTIPVPTTTATSLA